MEPGEENVAISRLFWTLTLEDCQKDTVIRPDDTYPATKVCANNGALRGEHVCICKSYFILLRKRLRRAPTRIARLLQFRVEF